MSYQLFCTLLAAVLLVSTVAAELHAKEPTNPSCGPTAKYQHKAPQTPDEFERLVVQGEEVFAVRFHNDSDIECRQLGPTWEKFAITYHKKIRLVTYYMDNTAVSEVMAAYLGVKQEGYPNLKLYMKRSKTNPLVLQTRPNADPRPMICTHQPALRTTLEELEHDAEDWDADHPMHHPKPDHPEEDTDSHEHEEHIISDEDEEGTEQFKVKILPGHKLKKIREQQQARREELDALSKQVHHCHDGAPEGSSVAPEVLLSGEGTSFSILRRKLDAMLDGLTANSEGYFRKRA